MVGTSDPILSVRPIGARLQAAWLTAQDKDPKLSLRELAHRCDMQHSKLSRIFHDRIRPKPEDIRRIAGVLGLDGLEVSELITRVHLDDGPQWLAISSYDRKTQQSGLEALIQCASALTYYSAGLIPGILQTPDYARAVLRAAKVPEWEIETRVEERMQRSHILIRKRNPARLTVLLGQEALLKQIGGQNSAEVMQEQLLELLSWASPERANVEVLIVPIAVDWTPLAEGSALILGLDNGTWTAVHIETRATSLFLRGLAEVAQYEEAADTVRSLAMSQDESRQVIADIAQQLEHNGREIVA